MGKNHIELGDVNARWAALVDRVMLSLDEEKTEQFEKRNRVAEKKLKRAGLEAPPVDCEKVKKVLLYYEGGYTHARSVKEAGISQDDILTAYDLWPISKTVVEYLYRRKQERLELENVELVEKAQQRLSEALDDVDGAMKVNPKILELTLSRLDRKRFGDSSEVASRATGGDQMVYQISNVNINMLGDSTMDKVFPKGGVVDVDSVVRELEAKERLS